CQNNLKQIGLALHNHHDVHKRFPRSYGGGSSLLLWTFQILPFIEQDNLAKLTYLQARERVIPIFVCPSDPNNQGKLYVSGTIKFALTSYLGNVGRNWLEGKTGDTGILNVYPACPGIKLEQITDGASNTLLVGERPPQANGYWGRWLGAADYDATIWAINPSDNAPQQTSDDGKTPCPLPAIFSPGTANDRCHANHWWSAHAGGANFLLCDGSVRFFSYEAGATVVPAMATRAGGEVVTVPD